MTAIILAGGKATRMKGRDKAFLKINHEPLIRRQQRLLKKLFKQIIIVTNSPEKYNNFNGVKVISDLIPHQGPLGGIFSGLLASCDKYNFVIACDMPFLNEALIRHMIEKRCDYDVLIPKIDGKFHPLFGLYSKNCIPIIEEMLRQNELKVSSIFAKVKCHFVLRQEIERFDRGLVSLLNINSQSDLAGLKGMRGILDG